jgi:hypothetical protein
LQASIQIPYHAGPMSVHTPDHEPSLFDPKPGIEAAQEPMPTPVSSAAAEGAEPVSLKEPRKRTKQDGEPKNAKQNREAANAEQASELVSAEQAGESVSLEQDSEATSAADDNTSVEEQDIPKSDRKRLAEQLDALRRKEAELLRALAITDHPELADAIRTIEARVYCVARADAKLAQGLSKSEARRQEALSKKLTALREKRSELDTQIATLEAESKELGTSRLSDFQRERQDALQDLMVALATHDPALEAAGLDVRSLLPELSGLLPELEAIARSVSESRADA